MEPKILTIDDDAVTRAIICATFQTQMCRILQASTGPEGLVLARHERPELILLDFDLPGMSGPEVLAQLKEEAELRHIPVVMLTINSQRDSVTEVLKLGVKDYIVKPFTRNSLLERVRRLLPLQAWPHKVAANRRFDEPLQLLVVEDKPAILEQIRGSLARTSWAVHGVGLGENAMAFCARTLPDAILISLSLPGEFAFTLFQALRSHPPTFSVPVVGLAIKTAQQEQLRAQQLGFSGCLTKPLDLAGLPEKLAQLLGLESANPWFRHRADCLVLRLPEQLDRPRAEQMGPLLRDKIREEIDAGLRRAVIDLSAVQVLNENLRQLAAGIVAFCEKSELPFALVGSEALRDQCPGFEETRGWDFAPSFEAARARLEPAGLDTGSEAN